MSKPYHWPTGPNVKYVDVKTDRAATAFIDSCTHLTPEKTDKLDNLLQAEAAGREDQNPDKTVCEPDPEVIEAVEAPPKPSWMDAEPDKGAYEHDDALEKLRKSERARAAH